MKEVGVYFAGCRKIAKMVEAYYNNLWTLASLNASAYTTTAWDQQWQINRTVPCWSYFVPELERCRYDVAYLVCIYSDYELCIAAPIVF